MTLLFEDEASRPIAQAKPLPSGFFSLLVHASAVIVMLWISFSPAALTIPDRLRLTMLVAPSPPPPPPPPATVAVRAAVRSVPSNRFTFPTAKVLPNLPSAKESILAEEPPEFDVGSAPGVPGGIPGGVPGGVIGGMVGSAPVFSAVPAGTPPAPVAKAPVATPPAEHRIQVSGEVQEAMLLVVVRPQYPPLAKRARIQGTVRMSAIINKEGKIIELKVIDGHPFLVDAAVEVVRKWRYRPTYLGGEPVEVATQIIMRFHLDQ